MIHIARYIWFALGTIGIIVVGLIAAIFYNLFASQTQILYELIVGLTIILGVSVLSFLLFVMAAAYKSLELSDAREALGLPPGSVRAMIALLLIIIWAIVSIFVLRFIVVVGPGAANSDASKLAQQLFTTMSTLVVAISAFYFATAAPTVTRDTQASARSQPLIRKIDPDHGKPGNTDYSLSIQGKNFRSPKSVRLVQDDRTIEATEILSNDTEIRCEIDIATNQKQGSWDLIVMNGDSGEDRLVKAFQITA